MSIGLAFQAFFAVLFRKDAAEAVRMALNKGGTARVASSDSSAPSASTAIKEPNTAKPPIATSSSSRSDALTLLSTLQREARLLDLLYEPLESIDDAQVGAAARQVIKETQKALNRMFTIEPLASASEGETIDIPKPASPIRYKLVGRAADGASRAVVVHRGWKADRSQVPQWTGSKEDSLVLAPIEIEVDG